MLINYNTYIHIPFCIKKCDYCDFVSCNYDEESKNIYVKYLLKEIELYKRKIDFTQKQKTIYFGGGTPSLLSAKNLEEILNNFIFDSDTEITMEINPKSISREKLKDFKSIGINRLSIGFQSFSNKSLNILGRIHGSEDAIKIYETIKELDFDNVSIDLMFSIPGQNINELEKDLKSLFQLKPKHFSIYSLIWEEGTKFYDNLIKGLMKKNDDEIEAIMYEKIMEESKLNGYEHYEISNFSLKGYESKHNLNYWENGKYLGLGLNSSGYIDNVRYKNYSSFEKYYNKIDKNFLPISEEEILTPELEEQYKYILAFRQLKKVVIPSDKYREIFDKCHKDGYLLKNDEGYLLSKKGLMFHNDFISNFL